jgi:hypothetical protein
MTLIGEVIFIENDNSHSTSLYETTTESATDGMRVVNVTSQDGSALRGSIRIRIATSKSEL